MLGSTSASASNSNNLICGYPIRHGAVIAGPHVKHRAQAQSQAQHLAGAQSNPEFKETKCISLEWKLSGLKNLFESSRGDVKSRCIKSAPFGEGKWEIFFYANSVCTILLPADRLDRPFMPGRPEQRADSRFLTLVVDGLGIRLRLSLPFR